jgi:hypothetical protein
MNDYGQFYPQFPYNEEDLQEQQSNMEQDNPDVGRQTPPRPPYQGGPEFGGQMPPGPPYQGGPGGYAPPRPPYQGGGPPTSPPPAYTPQMGQAGLYAVDPGSMRRCLYRYTYVWLRNGRSFWFYPVFIGRDSVAGYRWRRNQQRWVYFGIDADLIRSFQCY